MAPFFVIQHQVARKSMDSKTSTMKVALGVEYDGSSFFGWQAQKSGVRTVQEVLEEALSRVANHSVRVVCAGRTDTGVHATGQVIHFETLADRSPRNWVLGSNVNLPDDVSVNWAKPVDMNFHARFSAVGREYRYWILNRMTRSALMGGRATWIHRPLCAESMHQAARLLLGTHDFSSYRALQCQAKSPVRTIKSISVTRRGEMLELHVEADAFLHHMIRNIAGVLIEIGKGEQPVDWSAQVLEHRDRRLGGVTAPPHGLYFERVHYPEAFEIPFAPREGVAPNRL